MGKPVKVNGLLSIRMDVLDKSGSAISLLSSATLEPTHVIYIENISGGTRSVKFVNTLPNGTNLIEFTGAGVSPARWEDEIDDIPDGKTRERSRALLHKRGTAKKHPIQCNEVHQVLGSPPAPGDARQWTQETDNVPFDHEIDIDP
jgi:hypothetical protein